MTLPTLFRLTAICCLLAVPMVSVAQGVQQVRVQDRYRLHITTGDGDEHMLGVLGFSHEVLSPRDAASGLPTGKRQHKPFTVTKPVDKSTPLMLRILTNNENITGWRLEHYRAQRNGALRLMKTITLMTPSISGWRNTALGDTTSRHSEREHISFTYRKIIWTFQDGGVTAEDDWETPVS